MSDSSKSVAFLASLSSERDEKEIQGAPDAENQFYCENKNEILKELSGDEELKFAGHYYKSPLFSEEVIKQIEKSKNKTLSKDSMIYLYESLRQTVICKSPEDITLISFTIMVPIADVLDLAEKPYNKINFNNFLRYQPNRLQKIKCEIKNGDESDEDNNNYDDEGCYMSDLVKNGRWCTRCFGDVDNIKTRLPNLLDELMTYKVSLKNIFKSNILGIFAKHTHLRSKNDYDRLESHVNFSNKQMEDIQRSINCKKGTLKEFVEATNKEIALKEEELKKVLKNIGGSVENRDKIILKITAFREEGTKRQRDIYEKERIQEELRKKELDKQNIQKRLKDLEFDPSSNGALLVKQKLLEQLKE